MGLPLHICHLAKFYPPATGGIETHVRTLAQAQANMGHRVEVLCVNHQDRAGRDVTWKAFTPTCTTQEQDGAVAITRVGRRASLARLDLCPRLPRLLAERARAGVQLFHLHAPNPTMVLALALVLPRIPWVITHHSDVVKQRFLRLAFSPCERLIYRRALRIMPDSPPYQAGSFLLQRYSSKVEALPLGLDLSPYLKPSPIALQHAEHLRREHGWPFWLAVSRLVYYKGLHNAVRALPQVPGRLLVIGEGPLAGELQNLAHSLGVADRIAWHGRASDEELIGAYHAATALWFPSNARSEAFGLVQVEAMASGCPVLNCAIPASGVAWVSLHEETGLTVPVDDPAALASAALRLLNEPDLRERLAANARRRAMAEFDHRLMAQRSLAIYDRVLAGT